MGYPTSDAVCVLHRIPHPVLRQPAQSDIAPDPLADRAI